MSLNYTFIGLFIIIVFVFLFYLFITLPIFTKRINKNDITSDNTNADKNVNINKKTDNNDIEQIINLGNEVLTSSSLIVTDTKTECKFKLLTGQTIWDSPDSINQDRNCLLPGEGVFALNELICSSDPKLVSVFPNAPTYCYNKILAKDDNNSFPYTINLGDKVTAYQECFLDGNSYKLCAYNYVKISLNWSGLTSSSRCLTLNNDEIILKPCTSLKDYTSKDSSNQLFIINPVSVNDSNKYSKDIPSVIQLIPFNKQSKNLFVNAGKLSLIDTEVKRFFGISPLISITTKLTLDSNNQIIPNVLQKQQHLSYLEDYTGTIINSYNSYFSNGLYEKYNSGNKTYSIGYFDGVDINKIPSEMQNNTTAILIVN